jgi:ASC-1-like (ASCH) protein
MGCNRCDMDATEREVSYHLAILKKPYLELILSGHKTIELRLSKGRQPAFGKVYPGDKLALKVSAGPVCGAAVVADIKLYEGLTPEQIVRIRRQYNDRIMGSDAIWRTTMQCRYGFLVWLRDVRRVEPIRIDKKDWRAWVVLTRSRDFGLLDRTELWETANACDA